MDFVWAVIIIIILFRMHKMHKELTDLRKAVKRLEVREQTEDIGESKAEQVKEETTKQVQKVIKAEKAIRTEVSSEVYEVVTPGKTTQQRPSWFGKDFFSVESIISKLGIILLLIGVGFIFNLAYDEGHIIKVLAVVTGFLTSMILIFFAEKVRRKDRFLLSQVLYGGGIATLYITVYAAYQGYGLINSVLALVLMCAVTYGAFVISVTTSKVSVAVIGILGGLLTPFLLQLEWLGVFGIGIYIVILALSSAAIYIFKGWRELQLSSIVGTYIVTIYLLDAGIEAVYEGHFTVLLMVLLVVFVGTEYGLALAGKTTVKSPQIGYMVQVTLPFITLAHLSAYLELSDGLWAVGYGISGFLYLLLTSLFYKKHGNTMISDISISLAAFFGVAALVRYLSGDTEAIAVMTLALLFILIGKRMDSKVIRVISHIIAGVGVALALSALVVDLFDFEFSGIDLIVRMVILALIIFTGYQWDRITKNIYASVAMFGYGVIMLQGYLYHLAEDTETLAIMVAAHGIYILILFILAVRLDLLPKIGVLIVAMLPFVVRLIITVPIVMDEEVEGFVTLAYIFYSILVYVTATLLFGKEQPFFTALMKMLSYSIVFIMLVTELPVAADAFAAGLAGAVALILFIIYIEPQKNENSMIVFAHVIKGVWLTMVVFYVLLFEGGGELEVMKLIYTVVVLAGLFVVLNAYKKVPLAGRVAIHYITYMIVVYKTFIDMQAGDGTITLLWAAYALTLLTVSVIRVDKSLVNLSLAFIVFVIAKFIIIDLGSMSNLWKIIVSMAFGSALLVLSYMLQPILKRADEQVGTIDMNEQEKHGNISK